MSDGPSSFPKRLRALVGRVSLVDRAFYALVLLLLLGALFGQGAWKALDPGADLRRAYVLHASETDPWGRPYVQPAAGSLEDGAWPYSVGPNGIDERGLGDDIPVGPIGFTDELYRALSELLLLLAMGLTGLWEFGRWVRGQLALPKTDSIGLELTRAAGLALPFACVLALLVQWALASLDSLTKLLGEGLLVPLPVAVAGSTYLLCFLTALWFRLRRPPERRPGQGSTAASG